MGKHEAVTIAEGEWCNPIPKQTILAWMNESDIEVLGAVQDIITEQSTLDLISPPLKIAEIDRFLAVYFERCIRENPQGEWGG